MKSNSRKKGSILVFVLALIVFVSVLSVRLMKETTQELRHVSQFHRRDDLRTYAYSALDIVVGVLNEFKLVRGKLSSGQGWGAPLEYAEMLDTSILSLEEDSLDRSSAVKWNVSLIDESGKLPIQNVKDMNLATFLASFMSKEEGRQLVDEEDGRPLVEILRDWQDEDNEERDDGAEDDFYEDLDPPYFTPGRNVETFDEFKWIKGFGFSEDDPDKRGLFFDENGMETSSFRSFKSTFSFFNQDGLNPYGCSSEMLRVLAGDDNRLYEELVELKSSSDAIERQDYFQQMSQLASEMGLKLSDEVRVLRVEISVTRGKSVFKLHAVLSNQVASSPRSNQNSRKKVNSRSMEKSPRNSKIKYPLRILAIRENENLFD